VTAGTPVDLERLRTVGVVSRRSGDRVVEGRDEGGRRYKRVTDELNNTVTQRDGARRGQEHQDVLIRAPYVEHVWTGREVRQ
jgi:hypothetical protein